jgi:hypothetical protein
VQGHVGDDDTADGDRFKPRHRCQRAGAPDLNVDAAENGDRPLCRKLVGDGPARAAGDKAQPLLQGEIVNLVDNAVNIIAQRRSLLLDLVIMLDQTFNRIELLHQRIDAEPVGFERLHHAHLRGCRHGADLTPGIGEKLQRPRCGDRGIKLAQRPCRRIARIGENRLAILGLALVQRRKIRVAHIDLAAHLKHIWRIAAQHIRDARNGTGIERNVLARRAVTTGGRRDQTAHLVA